MKLSVLGPRTGQPLSTVTATSGVTSAESV